MAARAVKSLFGSSVDNDMQIPQAIEHLQDSFLKNPLSLKVCLRMVKAGDDDSKPYSYEQLMQLSAALPCDVFDELNQGSSQTDQTHIILVVDRSGSMSGNPFNQVKMALEEIVKQSIGDPSKCVDIIVYDSDAQTVNFGADNYKEVISGLLIGGMTSFKAAFDKVVEVMKTKEDENLHFDQTVVLFMTDGNDSVSGTSKVNQFAKAWAKSLKAHSHPVTVHSIGFSGGHDLQFLKRLCVAGQEEGLYRYCEPSDGPEALKDKLEELFDYVNVGDNTPVQFEVSLTSDDNKLVPQVTQSGTFEGNCQMDEREDGETAMVVSGECWIYVKDPAALPEISVGLQLTVTMKRVKYTIQIPCVVRDMERSVVEDKTGHILWNLAILSRNADILASQLSDAITGSKDVMQFRGRLERLQTNLSKTEVFNTALNKDSRAMIMNDVKEAQAKLDKMHSMLAQYLRGETNSVSLLARAHDLRYEAKFSKSRRDRLMNRRVAQNFNVTKTASEKAQVVKEEDLSGMSSEALDFYHCILSMYSVKDILTDPSDLENALGIGLAVSRPEFAVDDPTSIRIFSISASLVSRSSVMDALEYKINLEGQLSAHGGFSFDGQLSYATVGAGREPINAWLPLYVTEVHWERVKSCLRPSLGYLCTLDPMGYSDAQLDVLFMVLGRMIGHLYKGDVGENQLKLIFSLQRTCHACIEEFKLSSKISSILQSFIAGPLGRFRHVLPNLYTMIGYMASLPPNETKQALGFSEGYSGKNIFSQLWVAMVTELLRRANSSIQEFRQSENQLISLLNMLLHGQTTPTTPSEMADADSNTEMRLGQLCWDLTTDPDLEQTLDIPEFDPSQEVTVEDVKIKQSAKVDKAMAIWSQAKCGEIKNKNRSDQVTDAAKTIKTWVAKLREQVGLPTEVKQKVTDVSQNSGPLISPGKAIEVPSCGADSAGYENSIRKLALDKANSLNTKCVNSSILQVTAKLLTTLSKHCNPPLACVPGCVAFLEYWLTSGHSWQDVKDNGEMPPDKWISDVKAAVAAFFNKLEAYKKQCEDAAEPEDFNNSNGDGGGGGGVGGEDNPQNDGQRPRGEGPVRLKDRNDEESEDDVYSEDEEVDETIAAHLARNRTQKQERVITLPMLIRALNPQGEMLELVRAMLCQAVSYPSNSQARDAATSGELCDLSVSGHAHTFLCRVEADLLTRKESALKKLQDQKMRDVINLCLLRADSMWSFIGYLITSYKERDEGFSSLINYILECPGVKGFPLLAEKILVLLSGRYQEHTVLAKGNAWLPDKKLTKQFEQILGEEAWTAIERDLVSHIHIHVYRESDIPNRHGHCNSNPYITNRVREILNMPLIEEKVQPRTSKRKHRNLNNDR